MKELRHLSDQAINGEIEALEVYIKLNNALKEIENLKKEILECALHEFDMYDQKSIEYKGFEIKKTQSARYSFENVNAWNNIKNKLKKIEDYAKLAEKQGDLLILETGEIIEPATKTYSNYGLAIKAKK